MTTLWYHIPLDSTDWVLSTRKDVPTTASHDRRQGKHIFNGPLPNEYRLTTPLVLTYEVDEEGTYSVDYSELLVYGVGDSLDEAVEDLAWMLIESIQDLLDDEPILSDALKIQLQKLSQVVVR